MPRPQETATHILPCKASPRSGVVQAVGTNTSLYRSTLKGATAKLCWEAPERRPRVGATRWYAVQVETGRERAACALVLRTAEAAGLADAFDELFSPGRHTLSKVHGKLVEGLEPLLPGYVIAVARPDDLDAVAEALRRTPRFARLVGVGETFAPLSDQEVSWICAFTQRGDRTVEMSEGFVEGGRVVVTSGPLVGKEVLITKVNRRKRTAEVELSICGRKVTTKVGLNLTRKNRY